MGFFESQHKYEVRQLPKPLTFAIQMHPARAVDIDTCKGLILFFFTRTIQVCSFLSEIFELLVFDSIKCTEK